MSALQFVPFQSMVQHDFWMSLGEHKLEKIKLSEDPLAIHASFGITPTIKHRSSTDAVNTHDAKSTASNSAGVLIPSKMRLDSDSLNGNGDSESESESESGGDAVGGSVSNEKVRSVGSIQILNTIESFKKTNKNELLNRHCLGPLMSACGLTDDGELAEAQTETDADMECLDALTQFFCLCHLDLKAHKVVFWFAFPVLAPKPGKAIHYFQDIENMEKTANQLVLRETWGDAKVQKFYMAIHDFRLELLKKKGMTKANLSHPSFFMAIKGADRDDLYYNKCLELSYNNYSALSREEKDNCIFVFLDPTRQTSSPSISNKVTVQPVGWTLRNLVAYITLKLKLTGSCTVMSFRPGVIRRIDSSSTVSASPTAADDSSLLLNLKLPERDDYYWLSKKDPNDKKPCCVGWELNARSKPGPRSINLAPLLSPAHLANQATDLNLKLMKWRMIPTLDLDQLSNLKVLLLGAGTLGCSVARTLLGWGVQHFKFVDNGKVSYSNPVRQNLFELSDCEGGGKDKATAAADALKKIAGPTIESEGYVLTIPMPGHSISANEEASIQRDVEKIQELTDEADVVFLLTDTRESRWLPTVMARASNKMMINAALGLDSWLVMRHGGNEENRLGCYFCNDVVAPENSTNNRTLDQQCTVTRPGLAPIASSMAVELCISLLHHEKKQNAPAPIPSAGASSFSPTVKSSDLTSPLGVMPHQIRGSIVSYTMMTPTVPAFKYCTGCCDDVVHAYTKHKFSFVKDVCNSVTFLEDTAGLKSFREEATMKMEECLDWDEDSEGDEDF